MSIVKLDKLKKEKEQKAETVSESQPTKEMFRLKPFRQTLRETEDTPRPNRLFGDFWYQGEVCILFADTNVGKSILAVQIADAISKGIGIAPFAAEVPAEPVLYFDFELSPAQVYERYSNEWQKGTAYNFSQNLIRPDILADELEVDYKNVGEYEKIVAIQFELAIIQSGAKVVIVDNITWLKMDTSQGGDAGMVMKLLVRLKKKYGLSLLILAHTPKRDNSRPITSDDLKGNSILRQLCDSMFAVGKSALDGALRYIKQIKVRQQQFKYDGSNVIIYGIHKPDNFVYFEFQGYDHEGNHLRDFTAEDQKELEQYILDFYQSHPSMSLYRMEQLISDQNPYGKRVYRSAIRRVLKKNKIYDSSVEIPENIEPTTPLDPNSDLPF